MKSSIGGVYRASKYHRNVLQVTPASCLPPEILTLIFSLLSPSACDKEVCYIWHMLLMSSNDGMRPHSIIPTFGIAAISIMISNRVNQLPYLLVGRRKGESVSPS